jgi:Domain of unknown function (DUF3883)
MTAQAHLNEIQKRWTTSDPKVVATAANAIEDIIHSIFGDAARIGYELLQNADDAGSPSNNIEVKYYLLDKHLIIQHNGSHFNYDNVEALCRYGAIKAIDESKQNDIEKIGYKGIGFKSVFNIADKVWILSKDYTFRFDKSHWEGKELPWQIVPIYTDASEISDEVSSIIKPECVNFILELKDNLDNNKSIKGKIAKSLENEQNLLFLRHVTNFELLYKDTKGDIISYRKILKAKNEHLCSLEKYENNSLKMSSYWHISTFSFTIPNEIRDSLKGLDKRQCPEKLKNAESIELSFAAKLKEDNTIIPLKGGALIFSYLPTEAEKDKFPFIVNSNFLLNEARTILLKEEWNYFIFQQIGYYQFEWFQQMAYDERFRFEFAGLLIKYDDKTTDKINQSVNKGAYKAQSEIAFVPVLKSKELKKASDTIVDKTGISYKIEEYGLVQEEFEKTYEIADPKIKSINKLIEVGANEFNRQKLSEAIKKGKRFKNPTDNIKLIDYFYQHINALTNPTEVADWIEILRETSFLLDNDNNLQKPPSLYFPEQKPELLIEISMNFLHEVIYNERIKADSKLEQWLGKLNVAFPKPIEIIRRGIYPLIEKEQVNNQNIILITKYIFEHQTNLDTKDFEKLSHLPVLTKGNSIRKAMSCYLCDDYEPNLKLEQFIKDDIFVSISYLNDSKEFDVWKNFWLRLCVRQDMDLETNEEWYDFNKLKKNPKYTDYSNFLIDYLPQHKEDGAKSIYSLLIPRYLQYACTYDFALQYWDLLLNQRWSELIQKSKKAKFKHTNGSITIPSYFEYLVRENMYFPADDKKCYPTTEVFSASLKSIIKDWKPISYYELSSSQEELLGIQSHLTFLDCKAILEYIALGEDELDKERITALYEYIVSNRFEEQDVQGIKLLAINNTFQSVTDLQYFNVPKSAVKADSANFIFLELETEESLNFCNLFGIKVIGIEDLELKYAARKEEKKSLNEEWNLKLTYLASISSSKKGVDYESEYTRLKEKTKETEFIASENLSLVLGEGDIYAKDVYVWQKNSAVYYHYDWQDRRVFFELAEVLSDYFEIKETEREIELVLTLEKQDVYIWLEKQGFDVFKIKEVEEVPPITVKTYEPSTGFIFTVCEPEPQTYTPPLDGRGIGYLGEKYVNDKGIIKKYYQEKEIEVSSIIWLNEKNESIEPFDFKVELEGGGEHFWEVKSTPSETKMDFQISANEIKHAFDKAESYFIIRVFNAKEETTKSITILSNPLEKIKNGEVKINDANMVIMVESKSVDSVLEKVFDN